MQKVRRRFRVTVLDDEENKQYPQANRRYREEVDGDNFPEVIPQECLPTLRRRSLDGLQYSRNASFGDRDSELEQLTVNSGCAPQRVRFC